MGHVAAAGQLSWRGAWLAALVTLLGSWIQPFASPSSQQALALGGALRTAGPARGVPSGSSDPSGSRGARTGAEAWRVQRPPAALRASLGLAATYLKHVDAGGLAVLGSWRVPDHALLEAAHIVTGMLRAREDLRATLVDAQARVVVMAIDEMTTDVPEFAKLEPADFWDRRARGLGGSARIPVTSCGEENLLHYGGDPYAGESILVHEFAHTLHQLALGSEHDQRLRSTYEAAMAAGLWEGRYAARDHGEYWAEGVQSWFGANRQHDHDHNHVDTREELADYDPGLARLVESVFGANSWRYLPPNDRAYADHLRDFDASSAPRFAWPEHLPRWSQEDEAWHQFLKRRPLEDVLAWTQRLAEAGDGWAQVNLGWRYREGRGVERDDAQALRWYRRAAEGGDAAALGSLGWMYKHGRGVQASDAEAVQLFGRAARMDNPQAQYDLALMLVDGRGDERAPASAIQWMRLAADSGHAGAAGQLRRWASTLTEADFKRGVAQAHQWRGMRSDPPPER